MPDNNRGIHKMCVAGGIQQNNSINPVIRHWRRFASCPFRLFTLAALIHAGTLFVVIISKAVPVLDLTSHSILFQTLYGLLATPVLGAFLFWLPLRFQRSPISYGWYSFCYLLLLSGLALIEIGLFRGSLWTGLGAAMIAIAWYMVIHAFSEIPLWANDRDKSPVKLLFAGLHALALGVISFAIGSLGNFEWMYSLAPLVLFLAGTALITPGLLILRYRKTMTYTPGSTNCMMPGNSSTSDL